MWCVTPIHFFVKMLTFKNSYHRSFKNNVVETWQFYCFWYGDFDFEFNFWINRNTSSYTDKRVAHCLGLVKIWGTRVCLRPTPCYNQTDYTNNGTSWKNPLLHSILSKTQKNPKPLIIPNILEVNGVFDIAESGRSFSTLYM